MTLLMLLLIILYIRSRPPASQTKRRASHARYLTSRPCPLVHAPAAVPPGPLLPIVACTGRSLAQLHAPCTVSVRVELISWRCQATSICDGCEGLLSTTLQVEQLTHSTQLPPRKRVECMHSSWGAARAPSMCALSGVRPVWLVCVGLVPCMLGDLVLCPKCRLCSRYQSIRVVG